MDLLSAFDLTFAENKWGDDPINEVDVRFL